MHFQETGVYLMTFNRIGILRLSAIGDAVMVVPMIRVLQKNYPRAEITWIIGRAAYSLLKGLSGVNFVVIDKPNSLITYYKFKKQLKAYKFDVLFAMQASWRTNLMYPLISAKRKIGFDKHRAKDLHGFFIKESIDFQKNHLLDNFMSFALHIGAKKTAKLDWGLSIEQANYTWLKSQIKKPYIAINPAASKKERNWLIERYIELVKQITIKHPKLDIIFTGDLSDVEMVQTIIDNTKATSLAGKTTLKQLAAMLDKAVCLIAPDTGPVHIATAMNTPVIGLYAVITARLSGPYLSQELTIDKYQQAVREISHKDPATIDWGHRVHSLDAMKLITVDDVLAKINKLFLTRY